MARIRQAVFVVLHGNGCAFECLSDFETHFALRLERNWGLRETGKRFITEYGFRLLLFGALLLFFIVLGHDGPVMFDDSGSYMWIRWHEGVMPVYPVFLLLNEYIFGEARYLWAVVAEQTVLAAFSVTILEEMVRVRFGLHPVEGILVCLLALYPYTIEMPVAVMTQAVLTEGLAYSLFYLFLAIMLGAIWDKSYIRLTGAFCMTLFLSAVRSQLQILFGVCGIIFLYLICMRKRRETGGKKLLRVLAGLAGCAAVSMAGVLLVFGMVRGYRTLLEPEHFLGRLGMEVQWPRVHRELLEEEEARSETEQQEDLPQAENAADRELLYQSFSTSQYMTLIFSRGMYEADYEDAALFQDPLLRGLYLALYDLYLDTLRILSGKCTRDTAVGSVQRYQVFPSSDHRMDPDQSPFRKIFVPHTDAFAAGLYQYRVLSVCAALRVLSSGNGLFISVRHCPDDMGLRGCPHEKGRGGDDGAGAGN